MRTFGYLLVIVGIVVCIGNLSKVFPTIPGIGVATALIGCIVLRFHPSYDMLDIYEDEWN